MGHPIRLLSDSGQQPSTTIPISDDDGAAHMCLDEALLEQAQVTTLRLYRWPTATLSLGYFQDHDAVTASLPAPMPVVRRITGGGAIWHHHEITYALIGRLGQDGLPQHPRQLYPLLHGAILKHLHVAGAHLTENPCQRGDHRFRTDPRCFASPAPHDLIAPDQAKVLGSAARTRHDRVLIHGSLKLASNPWDGPAVAGCGLAEAPAAQALLNGLLAALNATADVAPPEAQELAAAAALRQARYSNNAWITRRHGPPA